MVGEDLLNEGGQGQWLNVDIESAKIGPEICSSGAEGLQGVGVEVVERHGEDGAYGDELKEETGSERQDMDPFLQEGEGAPWLLGGGGSHCRRRSKSDRLCSTTGLYRPLYIWPSLPVAGF
jgi:hypothetical protein